VADESRSLIRDNCRKIAISLIDLCCGGFECNGLVTTVSAPAPPPDAKKAAQTSGGERGYICRETCGSGHGPRGCAPQEPECASLVPIDIKHSGQSGHLQQVVDSLVQIYEPKLATLIANCGVSLN
jgi:hypothetical protein